MSEDGSTKFENSMRRYLTARVSRAKMIATVGAGVAAVAVPSLAGAQTTSTPESTQDIINIADTAEHLAITLLNAAVGAKGALGLSGLTLDVVEAALAEEVYHSMFLESAGAKTLTDTFTVPNPAILTDYSTFFTTVEGLETAFVAAYMRATEEFSAGGNQSLAQYAYQIGSVEAEHRTLARAALALGNGTVPGNSADVPPNNLAFESDLFGTVADAAKALEADGFIGGSGTQVMFPGFATALATADGPGSMVTNTKPTS
ncbi:MAG: ferritin-like domain-containing protein [Chloroflexota bacterium]